MVERWIELTDDHTSWWARPTGVGLRLQLKEIEQLAAALQGGEVVAAAVKRLLTEARGTFVADGHYCAQAFPAIVSLLSAALRDREAAELLPGGNALAAVEASVALLAEVDLIATLMTDTGKSAAEASSVDDFLQLDERIVLLDAELAFDGYSRQWRRTAAVAARDSLAAGESPAEALKLGVARAGLRDRSEFDVIVPVRKFVAPDDPALNLHILELEQAEERVAGWSGGPAKLTELVGADAAIPIRAIIARDIDAATEVARDRLARDVSLWQLQDGVLHLGDNLLLHDVAGKSTHARPILRKLIARPAGLKTFQEARSNKDDDPGIRRLADALDQLAQARTGSHGASLADLWTVAETLFGGVAEDKSVEVGERLAGLAEYLYVRDLLRWLGTSLKAEDLNLDGLTRQTGEGAAEFGLRCVENRARTLPPELVARDRPLEWVRLAQVLRWDHRGPKDKCHLAAELAAIHDRVAAVANRAYLVRNLFLHQGNPDRAAAMAVTVPVFASILDAVVSYINHVSGESRLPLVSSELAQLRIRHVAAAYSASPKSGPAPLADLVELADD